MCPSTAKNISDIANTNMKKINILWTASREEKPKITPFFKNVLDYGFTVKQEMIS